MAAMAGVEGGLSSALGKLMAISESYPDLKANANFMELQRDLVDTEDKIQASRRFFNATIQEFNTIVEVFPSNIVAKMFGFKKKEFFELDENDVAKDAVEVKF